MGRVHLLHQKEPSVWFILEEGKDYIGAMHNGEVSILGTDDIYQADSYTDLLCMIQDKHDDRFMVYLNTEYDDGRTGYDYPDHWSIGKLVGFVRSVATGKKQKDTRWRTWVGELWVRENEECIRKVRDFNNQN